MPKRSWASAALVAGLCLAGCGGPSEPTSDSTLTVYVSLPLRGPSGDDGRDAADGARLALADAGDEAGGVDVEARYLDDTEGSGGSARWTPGQAGANARTATENSTAIAYLGDFESGATRASLPITNGARLLQVSPASSAEDLVEDFPGDDELPETQPGAERTFGRVIPSDAVQGAAAAAWAGELGWGRVRVVDDGTEFGQALADGFEAVLPSSPAGERRYLAGYPASFGAQGDDVSIGGEPGQIVNDSFLGAGERVTTLLDASYATSAALDPSQLPPAGRDFARRFRAEYGRAPGRYAAYGYEAMAVILDSIERASDPADRAAVIDAFFETDGRDSVLGAYSIDELGETTLDRVTGYELAHGRPDPVAELSGGA